MRNDLDFDLAYNHCRKIAVRHYENFPVGSLLIPKNKRKFIYSIYAFARTADDIADSEMLKEDAKLNMLNDFEHELDKIIAGKLDLLKDDTKLIFIALSNTINELKINTSEFRNLLAAFRQDAVKCNYETFDELISYSSNSANPIGHLVLYVFGFNPASDKECFERSDDICTGLQLTNFWQDVSVDLRIPRIYIPDEIMRKNNYSRDMLLQKKEDQDFRKTMCELVEMTRIFFERGRSIVKHTSGRLKFELKATIAGGEEILKKIRQINYNVLSERVSLNNFDKIKLLPKLIG